MNCKFEECGRPAIAKGLCHPHYQQHRKGKDLTPVRPKSTHSNPLTCTEDECQESTYARGLCRRHYSKWAYHNQPVRPLDVTHHNYKGDDISYETAHGRVRKTRGHAKIYWCVDCDKQATDWSLKHDAENVVYQREDAPRNAGCAYSIDPMDYEPRCSDCHRKYDAKHRDGYRPRAPKALPSFEGTTDNLSERF